MLATGPLAALCVAGLLAPPIAVDAQQVVTGVTKARIDATLEHFVDTGSVAGVSALVYEKGKEVYFGAFGMADREARAPMTRDAIVQIFSMTKPITGVALMTLYEQGKFELDDLLSKYVPGFANDNPGVGALYRAADVGNRSNTLTSTLDDYGIDVAVRTRPPADALENNGVVGEFFWDGAASTLFWVDPVDQLVAVLFVQLMPFDGVGLHKGFRDAVYGPLAP